MPQGREGVPVGTVHVVELLADGGHWVDPHTIPGRRDDARLEAYGARWQHTASVIGHKIYVFGGLNADNRHLGDLHILDTSNLHWREVLRDANEHWPAPRAQHTTASVKQCMDIQEDGLLLIGGYGGSGRLFSSLEHFNALTELWQVLEPTGTLPRSRFDHSATVMEDTLVLCGGQDTVGAIDDIFLLDLATLTWSKLLDGADGVPDARTEVEDLGALGGATQPAMAGSLLGRESGIRFG